MDLCGGAGTLEKTESLLEKELKTSEKSQSLATPFLPVSVCQRLSLARNSPLQKPGGMQHQGISLEYIAEQGRERSKGKDPQEFSAII